MKKRLSRELALGFRRPLLQKDMGQLHPYKKAKISAKLKLWSWLADRLHNEPLMKLRRFL